MSQMVFRPKLRQALLIDDDPAANYIHKRSLEKLDLFEEIVSVESGEDALGYLLENEPPNLIFLDINMPGINGWEFIEEYKKLPHEYQQTVMVLMLTTSTYPDDLEKAIDTNQVKEFMNKPLTIDLAREVITKHATQLGVKLIDLG